MRSIYLSLGLIAITLFACDKEPELHLDGVPESVTQLIDDNCVCDPQIGLFKWNEQLLYMHSFMDPACDTVTSYYDEEGNPVELTLDEQDAFREKLNWLKRFGSAGNSALGTCCGVTVFDTGMSSG